MKTCEICETPCKTITCSDECKRERRRRIEREAYAANPRQKAQNQRYYAANRERVKARMKEYRRQNPTYNREYFLKKKYGLTAEEWDELLIQQSGRCWICEEPMDNPAVDHDHETGAVRGLLCTSCNTGLGHFRDDVDRLRAAIAYLSR